MEQLLFPLAAVYDPPINMDLTKPSLLLLLLLVPTSTSYLFFYCSGRIFFSTEESVHLGLGATGEKTVF